MPLKRYYRISKQIPIIIFIWVFLLTMLTILLVSCMSFEHLTTVSEDFPRASKCGKCHVETYNEWSQSDHAKAYTNPNFRQSTNNYNFKKCLNCHSPQPTLTEQVPGVRKKHLEEGITCVSCHLEEGKLSGPIEPTGKVAPHSIGVRPEFYRDSKICGNCHQGTYEEWLSVKIEGTKTCQDCHMSAVTRKVTQATGGISNIIVAFEREVPLKRHDFIIENMILEEGIISVEIEKNNSIATIIIKNNLPHSLPTGDFGFRVLVLEITASDTKGKETILKQLELAKELKNSIAAFSKASWQIEIPLNSKFIQIRLFRHSYEEDEIIKLADIKVPLQ